MGGGQDNAHDLAVAVDGSVYVTGATTSVDFPTTPGAFDTTFGASLDAFISHLTSSGSGLVFSTFLGGDSMGKGDSATGIALAQDGMVYVTGSSTSPDFPTTPGAYDTMPDSSDGDGFVTKLKADGSQLVYSTFLGGNRSECIYTCKIVLGTDGSAYIASSTDSTDFPTTPGTFQTRFAGWWDVTLTRLNPEGSSLIYSTYVGGYDGDFCEGLALGQDGSVVVVGWTISSDFPTTPGAFDRTLGEYDAFVSKVNADGSALVYSTYLGGDTGGEEGDALALGPDGSAYVTGHTFATDFPTTPGAFQIVAPGGHCHGLSCGDAFITHLNADGSALVYSTYLGGTGTDAAYGLALGPDGSTYVTGSTSSANFPVSPGAYDTSYNGRSDVFVTRLNADGSRPLYSTYLGGSGAQCYEGQCDRDEGDAIALGADGAVYVTGYTPSFDFPTTPGAFDTSFNGDEDAFVVRLSPDRPVLHVAGIDASYRPSGNRYRVGAGVTIQDENDAPVPGAAVTVEVALPNGQASTVTRTTNQNGRVLVGGTTVLTGTYTFTVTDVSKAGSIYNPLVNVESTASVTVP